MSLPLIAEVVQRQNNVLLIGIIYLNMYIELLDNSRQSGILALYQNVSLCYQVSYSMFCSRAYPLIKSDHQVVQESQVDVHVVLLVHLL